MFRVKDLDMGGIFEGLEAFLSVMGPLRDFTVQKDLEKGALRVWGETSKGYLRYTIKAFQGKRAFSLFFEKVPKGDFFLSLNSSESIKSVSANGNDVKESILRLREKDEVVVSGEDPLGVKDLFSSKEMERLSFGNHKAQDWDMVVRRCDLREIFPVWMRLAQMLPERKEESVQEGTMSLLYRCSRLIEERKKTEIYEAFLNAFMAGFYGILCPRLEDTQYQGFFMPPADARLSSLCFLKEGAKRIKSLFISSDACGISILPALPPEFHCGRYIEASCGKLGKVDIEWSKKSIRRLSFLSDYNGSISFVFQNKVKSFRLREKRKERGCVVKCGKDLVFEAGKRYFFDNFEK